MYFLKASDFQRPKTLIFASEKPFSATYVAAPILKLCPLYLVGSRLHTLRQFDNKEVKLLRVTGMPLPFKNSGPLLTPRMER